MQNKFTQQFTCQEENVRLDKFLVAQLLDYSRTKIQKLITGGNVEVNGVRPSKHYFLQLDDVVTVNTQALIEQPVKEGSVTLNILYEDDDLLVLNKPAGVIVHQFADQVEYSLVDELLKKYPNLKDVGDDPKRPGIVHRIDKNVSGLMVVAKTNQAFTFLKDQFRQRKVHKEYMVLVHGKVEQSYGDINFRIGRSTSAKNRMAAFPANTEEGKDALSHFELVGIYKSYSLLRMKIETGRTHQIRVHLHALGYPVVGDSVYGGKESKNALKLDRIFLHSYKLAFIHPQTGQQMQFEVSLPLDLKQILNSLTGRKSIVLVSGPSGAGKTTLVKRFLERNPMYGLTTTYTTRQKRSETVEDKIMHNVTHEDFEHLREQGAFLEWAEYNGNFYGTHKESVLNTLKNENILINIEVQGAYQIMHKMPEVYSIFIDVNDDQLFRRLKDRGNVSEENIKERVEKIAPTERNYKSLYDIVLYNEDGKLDEAVEVFEEQIKSFVA